MKVYSLITATQERQQGGTTTRILLLNAVRILLNTRTSGALEFFSREGGGFFLYPLVRIKLFKALSFYRDAIAMRS